MRRRHVGWLKILRMQQLCVLYNEQMHTHTSLQADKDNSTITSYKRKYKPYIYCLDIVMRACFTYLLKEQSHEMGIFWKVSTFFSQYFLCMRWWFSRPFKTSVLTSYLLLWNYLLIMKMLTGSVDPSSEFSILLLVDVL
jgi:hypothetical protein